MDLYQTETEKTAGDHSNFYDEITNWTLGLTGEAGEVANIIKKTVFHGHDFDRGAIKDELGDCIWYIARMADSMGIPLSEIAEHNLNKLRKRYPDGFSKERSINREEEKITK